MPTASRSRPKRLSQTPPHLPEITMVSAVFHSPLEPTPAPSQDAMKNAAISAQPASAASQKHLKTAAAPTPRAARDWAALSRSFWQNVLPPLCGLGLLVGLWALVSASTKQSIPGPYETWLPIGLLVFKGANPAAIWTIFICSIWPMIINTAVGVQRVPQDYMNVARVLNLSEWKIVTKILFPSVLPYMLTGVRLAVGTAWLVIVAAEMLTGGVGIGFWVWDEWNNLNVKNIIIAIFVIGIVGLLLEYALIKIATAFTYEEVKS